MHQMRERDVCWAPHGPRTSRVAAEDIPAPCATMAAWLVIMRRLRRSSRTTSFQQNTALLTPIRRRRRE